MGRWGQMDEEWGGRVTGIPSLQTEPHKQSRAECSTHPCSCSTLTPCVQLPNCVRKKDAASVCGIISAQLPTLAVKYLSETCVCVVLQLNMKCLYRIEITRSHVVHFSFYNEVFIIIFSVDYNQV